MSHRLRAIFEILNYRRCANRQITASLRPSTKTPAFASSSRVEVTTERPTKRSIRQATAMVENPLCEAASSNGKQVESTRTRTTNTLLYRHTHGSTHRRPSTAQANKTATTMRNAFDRRLRRQQTRREAAMYFFVSTIICQAVKVEYRMRTPKILDYGSSSSSYMATLLEALEVAAGSSSGSVAQRR
jgi:hypothetical protein